MTESGLNASHLNPNATVFVPATSLYKCNACSLHLPKEDFSLNQFKKNKRIRRCKRCIRKKANDEKEKRQLLKTRSNLLKLTGKFQTQIAPKLDLKQRTIFQSAIDALSQYYSNHIPNQPTATQTLIFKQTVCTPFIDVLYDNTETKHYAEGLQARIPNAFKEYYLIQLGIKELKSLGYDAELILENIPKMQDAKQFEQKIMESLIHLVSPDLSVLQVLKSYIPLRFRLIYASKSAECMTEWRKIHFNRICNGFKHHEKYDVFAAVAFRETFMRDLDVKCSDFSYMKRKHQRLVKCLPTTFKDESVTTVQEIINEAKRNKSFDAPFDDENVELQHNPVPLQLFQRESFVEFMTGNNGYLIDIFACIIYGYLTGYSFKCKMKDDIIECYDYMSTVPGHGQTQIIKALSNKEQYTIKCKYTKHDFGPINQVEFHCLGNVICMGCVRVDSSLNSEKDVLAIKAILARYECDCANCLAIHFIGQIYIHVHIAKFERGVHCRRIISPNTHVTVNNGSMAKHQETVDELESSRSDSESSGFGYGFNPWRYGYGDLYDSDFWPGYDDE